MINKNRKTSMKDMFAANDKAVKAHNTSLFSRIAMVGLIVNVFALAASFIQPAMIPARSVYILTSAVCMVLFMLSRTKLLSKLALAGFYAEFASLFCLTLYLSVALSPDKPAASMLVVLTIFPVIFIDRFERLLGAELVMYITHIVLSYVFKGTTLGFIDLINCAIAAIVGLFCGFNILHMRLQALDFARLLALEKNTDMLTSLYNRRKLIQSIEDIEQGNAEPPEGVIVIDVDNFKQYNDSHGHAAGDKCLSILSKLLDQKAWGAEIEFYRFSGDEIVAFVWDTDEHSLPALAEDIRSSTAELKTDYGRITVSVGYVCCDDRSVRNYEKWIERADKAMYKAKKEGRNRVCAYRADS